MTHFRPQSPSLFQLVSHQQMEKEHQKSDPHPNPTKPPTFPHGPPKTPPETSASPAEAPPNCFRREPISPSAVCWGRGVLRQRGHGEVDHAGRAAPHRGRVRGHLQGRRHGLRGPRRGGAGTRLHRTRATKQMRRHPGGGGLVRRLCFLFFCGGSGKKTRAPFFWLLLGFQSEHPEEGRFLCLEGSFALGSAGLQAFRICLFLWPVFFRALFGLRFGDLPAAEACQAM